MSGDRAHQSDIKLAVARKAQYRGTARIKLEFLAFERDRPRELDVKNLERLKTILSKDCRRLELFNHIPALIKQEDLDLAIRLSGIPAEDLLLGPSQNNRYPELVFPPGYRLECLHGRHRVQAGKEVLRRGDKWWTVDLYRADTDLELQTYLIEEYSNEKKPTDGEIYRKIRGYHFQRENWLEKRWWTRLSLHSAKNLKQLFRHDELTAGFDALLDIAGLWDGMRTSVLHKVLAIRCDEEILHYLDHIREVWYGLVDGDKEAMARVDRATVKALELTAPRSSTTDNATLKGLMLSGAIFGDFTSDERGKIWVRLDAVQGLIPSLFTFFEDIKALEAYAGCMKHLTTISRRDTVSTAFESIYDGVDQQLDLGYRHLYAFAIRHYLEMPKESQGKDRLARPTAKADQGVLRSFAELAHRLGFRSRQIDSLKQRWWPFDPTASTNDNATAIPLVTEGSGAPKKFRCGLPRMEDYTADQALILVDNLHSPAVEVGEGITSFFVRKFVYLMFFGLPRVEDSAAHSTAANTKHGLSSNQAKTQDGRMDIDGGSGAEREAESMAEHTEEPAPIKRPLQQEQALGVTAENDPTAKAEAKDTGAKDAEVKAEAKDAGAKDAEVKAEAKDAEAKDAGANFNRSAREFAPDISLKYGDMFEDTIDIITFKSAKPSNNLADDFQWEDELIYVKDEQEVKRKAEEKLRDQFRLYDTSFGGLHPGNCYKTITQNGTYTVLAIPNKIKLNDKLKAFGEQVANEARQKHQTTLKRFRKNGIGPASEPTIKRKYDTAIAQKKQAFAVKRYNDADIDIEQFERDGNIDILQIEEEL